MANRYFNPDVGYFTSSGQALSGAQLFFYQTGTNTKQNTYSDSALSVANANPVILDSNGRAGSIFLQNLKYKVVLAPSTDSDPPTSPIWTMDPVYASDVSTTAQFQSVNGNPNSQLAGSKGSATVPASVAWDFTNNILYVCTTTGTISTAVWTAVNPTVSTTVPPPQGRLTPTTNLPVITSDVTGASTVYYTPYNGLLVPIYNGTSMIPTSIVSQLSQGLTSGAHIANGIYDFYVFLISGTPTLGTGPIWTAGSGGSITAGSCARGTGASGAALSMVNGILTNAVSMTITSGPASATTTTVPANQATYVGTMYVDGTAGQVSCHLTVGQNRKYGLWNCYNRQPIILQVADTTASWTYTTATVRASNNAPASFSGASFNVGSGTTCNGITLLSGVAEEAEEILFAQNVTNNGSGSPSVNAFIGAGLNSVTAFNGFNSAAAPQLGGADSCSTATSVFVPLLGINVVAALEKGCVTSVFNGTASNMLLQAIWRG